MRLCHTLPKRKLAIVPVVFPASKIVIWHRVGTHKLPDSKRKMLTMTIIHFLKKHT